MTQHVLNPSDVLPLGQADGGERMPVLHHGSILYPRLNECRFPYHLPHMVGVEGFAVHIQEYMAGFFMFPPSLVNQCLYGGG